MRKDKFHGHKKHVSAKTRGNNLVLSQQTFVKFLGWVKQGDSMHKPGKTVPGPWSRLKAPQKDQFYEY